MRQADVAKTPSRENIIEYVFTKLYFQGSPCTEGFGAPVRQDSPHLAKSAIGHLVPIKVLHMLTADMKAKDVYKMVRETRPDSAEIFQSANQRLISRLEEISRKLPEPGVPYRTYLRKAFKPYLPKKVEEQVQEDERVAA